MTPPATMDKLFEELLRIGDPYLALPAHIAAGGHALLGQLERLLLASSRRRLVFAALPFTPASFLARLLVGATPGIYLRVARNRNSDSLTLDRIYAMTTDEPTLRALANHRNASAELLGKLAKSDNTDIRAAIIRNPNTYAATLEELFIEAPESELATIARHVNASSELLLRIHAKAIPAASAEVVANRNCPRNLLAQSCLSTDITIRRKYAGNPALTPAQRQSLLHDPDAGVRAEALRTMLTPAPGYALEAEDCASQVRRVQARRLDLPEGLTERLSVDADPWVRRWLARNPSVKQSLITGLSADCDAGVRRSAGRNPECPRCQLAILARDEDAWVRAAVGCRPDLPREALQVLESDSSIDVLSSVARNPATRIEGLVHLSRHSEASVRRAVILNDNAPLSVLRTLFDDNYPLNRALLVGHRNVPLEDAWSLAEDPEPEVRFAVGKRTTSLLVMNSACGVAASPEPCQR